MGVPERRGIQRKFPERQPRKLVQPLDKQQREQQRVRFRKRRERGDWRGGWSGFLQRERQRESRFGCGWFYRWRVLSKASKYQQRAERSSEIGEPGLRESSESQLQPESRSFEPSARDSSLGSKPSREKKGAGEYQQCRWTAPDNEQ